MVMKTNSSRSRNKDKCSDSRNWADLLSWVPEFPNSYQYATKEISSLWLEFKFPGTENNDIISNTKWHETIVQLKETWTILLTQGNSSFLVGLMNLPECPANVFRSLISFTNGNTNYTLANLLANVRIAEVETSSDTGIVSDINKSEKTMKCQHFVTLWVLSSW